MALTPFKKPTSVPLVDQVSKAAEKLRAQEAVSNNAADLYIKQAYIEREAGVVAADKAAATEQALAILTNAGVDL